MQHAKKKSNIDEEVKASTAKRRTTRKRLSPEERERQFVKEAIRYFSEVGLSVNTHELAKRLGVTQPLLYRYFPSKKDLIDRIYKELYLGRWNPHWEVVLADRSIPFRDRLIEFYRLYTSTIFDYEWIRIYMFSGLEGADINKRYVDIIEERILKLICSETRANCNLPNLEEVTLIEMEKELVWNLHGGIFYFGVRKYIYKNAVTDDTEALITHCVDGFLQGAPNVFTNLHKNLDIS